MSYITDAVVTARYLPRETRDRLVAELQMREVDRNAVGGSKVWTADTFLAAYNYIDEEAWLAKVALILAAAELVTGCTIILHHESDGEDGTEGHQHHVWVWTDSGLQVLA